MSEPITNLPDAVREFGALPMPMGPEPLVLTEAQIEALAAAGNRVVNDMRHEDLCMCDAWPKACLSSGNFHMGDWDMPGLESALPAVLALWEQMRGGEMDRLRAELRLSKQRSERRRIAWRMAYQRAQGRGWAADRAGKRARDLQVALQDMLFTVIAGQLALRAAHLRVEDLLTERHTTNESLSQAAEALRADRDRIAELEAAPVTVYRAEHPDSGITLGHYGTREAARKHCETVLRREVADEVFLGWVPDDDSQLAAEELCIGHDFECSGYLVVPLEAPSEYDEEADE